MTLPKVTQELAEQGLSFQTLIRWLSTSSCGPGAPLSLLSSPDLGKPVRPHYTCAAEGDDPGEELELDAWAEGTCRKEKLALILPF